MNDKELINMYIEAYETGSSDLKSLNKWLKELKVNAKLIGRNGKIIRVVPA